MTPNGDRAYLMDLHCMAEADVSKVMESAGARIVDVRWTNSTQPSFNGKLEYLAEAPAKGYVSKQYCAVRNPQRKSKDANKVGV